MRIVGCLTGIATVLCLVCLTVKPCAAEDALQPGAWAMQFEINGDFDLTSFQGSTISLKKQTSDGAGYRLGLDVDLENRSTDSDQSQVTEYTNPDHITTSHGWTTSDRNSQSLRLALQRIIYPAPAHPIKFFYGIGPLIAFSRSHEDATSDSYSESIINNDPPDTSQTGGGHTERTTGQRSWSLGVTAALGVEWFVNRNISLLAEYDSNLQYTWMKNTLEETSVPAGSTAISHRTNDGNTEIIDFGSGAVKFGLSAYF